mgnify:CR=1 FL=1
MTQITHLDKLYQLRASIHFQGKTIVLASGVFDLLHQEHKNFLTQAKAVGDILLVGLETDARTHQLKGAGRPINSLSIRLANLARLRLADYVFGLPDNFGHSKVREDFILTLKPHILAVSNQTPYFGEKQRVMKLVDGQVLIVHPYNPAISTTKILAQMKKPTT